MININKNPSTILVTGAVGFIGSNVAKLLLKLGHKVVGIDNLDSYYDVKLKKHRLAQLQIFDDFIFHEVNICSPSEMAPVFEENSFDSIAHLAAKAGVRSSIEAPLDYVIANIAGTIVMLEEAKKHGIGNIVMASTSSLYSGMPSPYKEDQRIDRPLSPYAATKLGAEAQAHVWHHLHGINITILRYFTVYGPCGRPDMSPFKFIECVRKGIAIPLYGDGTQTRDFTYIDDVAEGTVRSIGMEGFHIINIGGGRNPTTINEMIGMIERNIGRKPIINFLEKHRADMDTTAADISKAEKLLGWNPRVDLAEGIRRTAAWHLQNAVWLDSIAQ